MPLSKVTKTSTFLLMMICCYLEAGAAPVAPSVNTEPVLECKDITVPSKEKIQISHEGNLYHFKFALPACGHASYQNQYPASFIVQELIDDFYKSGMLNITVTQDPASDPLAKDKFLLEVQQSILGKRFDYKEEVQLVYERNFIHMINQSHTIPGSVSKTLEPYQLLRDIQWKNDCEQESAGWCFTWDGYFSITWEWDKHQDLEEMKNYVIQSILPQVFKESYIRYENYIYKVANPLEKNKT
ncbi:Uncharacterised protein [Legionella wadsworthii]|uniref:Uncharacterized protein n=1 Tax=Legionella wadsworthii TaxID=28088 RepID=A0A378LPA1_9GAMM|nr:hypothetical protein [Legionella wadsworthii]STY28507.1 Uncharacterised protein [Legionella wadsworthii]